MTNVPGESQRTSISAMAPFVNVVIGGSVSAILKRQFAAFIVQSALGAVGPFVQGATQVISGDNAMVATAAATLSGGPRRSIATWQAWPTVQVGVLARIPSVTSQICAAAPAGASSVSVAAKAADEAVRRAMSDRPRWRRCGGNADPADRLLRLKDDDGGRARGGANNPTV